MARHLASDSNVHDDRAVNTDSHRKPDAGSRLSLSGRTAKWALLAVLWVCGLVAGFFGMLSVGAKYSCSHSAHGLACRSTGTVLGSGIIIGVVIVVTAVTLLLHDARSWRARWTQLVIGLTLLAAFLVAARAIIATA